MATKMATNEDWKTPEQAAADFELSVGQALDWFEGRPVDGCVRIYEIEMPDVADIRERLKLTQTDFAQKIGVPVATLRNWEQGRRHPTGPARVLLTVIDRYPDMVMQVLAEERGAVPVVAAG